MINDNSIHTLRQLEIKLHYYENKLNGLNNKGKQSKKSYLILIGIIQVIFLTSVCFSYMKTTFVFLDLIEITAIPVIVIVATQAYTIYLTIGQMRYECRDKLFDILTHILEHRELLPNEKKLFNLLFEKMK